VGEAMVNGGMAKAHRRGEEARMCAQVLCENFSSFRSTSSLLPSLPSSHPTELLLEVKFESFFPNRPPALDLRRAAQPDSSCGRNGTTHLRSIFSKWLSRALSPVSLDLVAASRGFAGGCRSGGRTVAARSSRWLWRLGDR
jgi:hypothetical protein